MTLFFGGMGDGGGRTAFARAGCRRTAVKLLVTLVITGLAMGTSCAGDPVLLLPEGESAVSLPPGAQLVARFVHLTDTHILDAESPGRFPGAQVLIPPAWRPWENLSAQILDGIVRSTNRIHASGRTIDFLVLTGDACDNAQHNELRWLLEVMDGREVHRLSGPDDRPVDARPPPALDPYAPFQAQGLYQSGLHGDEASIPWYVTIGNHEAFSMGVFPILSFPDSRRVAPLPLGARPGLLMPTVLDPAAAFAHGPLSPAQPGPPPPLKLPAAVTPVAERRFFTKQEFIAAMFETSTGPPGHGFTQPNGPGWYSVSPVPGLRMIALDTSDPPATVAGLPHHQGAVSHEQRAFLVAELEAAGQRGELVVVASHHPSRFLEVLLGSVLGPGDLQRLLNAHPNVVLHLAGHSHRNRVADRGGYIEIETSSTIDWPQEGRVIEVWRDDADGSVVIQYDVFSGVDDALPALGDDPLRPLREQARALARKGRSATPIHRELDSSDEDPGGSFSDRSGIVRLRGAFP